MPTGSLARIPSILDTEVVDHEKTLEQKNADQGPEEMRVDPNLITLAIRDMKALNRIKEHTHAATKNNTWYSNIGTSDAAAAKKIEIAPLYNLVSNKLANKIGDALEVVTFKSLEEKRKSRPRYHFDGHFHLNKPKNASER